MCVIYACKTALPPEDELHHGAWTNDDGAGIAWLAQEKDSKGKTFKTIKWKKGLKDEKEVLEFINKHKLPFPLVIHFRTASIGGKREELCHPFPIAKDAPLWTEGYAPSVLFHNGHLSKWDEWVLKVGLPTTEKFPFGPWSDSRALAWLVHLKGEGIIPFVHEQSRVVMFSAAPYEAETGEYEAATDHFNFYGNWIKKEGWSQSVDTFVRAAARRGCQSGTGFYRGEAYDGFTRDDDEEVVASLPICGVTPLTSSPRSNFESTSGRTNVWTIEELNKVLHELEEERKDAELTAHL